MSKLEPQQVSIDVLREKYAKGEERTIEAIRCRVAKALAQAETDPEQWAPTFKRALEAGFVPAGRIMSSAGTDIQATLINCFVQPVGDSVEENDDGYPDIYTALGKAAATMRRGGGVGYDFSRIRPQGAYVKKTHSHASGPLSFMQVYNASCTTVESAGSRRGAQMGVLRVDHPDIEAFVRAKSETGILTNFNISVGVTDRFMEAVAKDELFELVHKAEPSAEQKSSAYKNKAGLWVYKKIKARTLWNEIMRQTYDYSEPGVLFLDRMNQENNLHYCERLEATNPCAEEPLPPYGCCCLGSIDLTKFVDGELFTEQATFDFVAFGQAVRTAVRMLDNVLDVTYWPLNEQRQEAMNKRRIGLGFLGLGSALVMLGQAYDSESARQTAAKVTERLRDEAYWVSVKLAKEKGAFPLFDAEKYLASGFTKRLPENLRRAISKHGIRNSHLTAIAPTGTIALAFADNASNGIEPPFSWRYTRRKRVDGEHVQAYEAQDHAYRLYAEAVYANTDNKDPQSVLEAKNKMKELPSCFRSALEISARDHQAMVSAVQPYVDTSISKTINCPADYPFEDFKDVYWQAWETGAKGCATYRPSEVRGAVLVADEKESNTVVALPEPDRRVVVPKAPKPALASLRWHKRPVFDEGNPAMTYLVEHPNGARFAVFIGYPQGETEKPFEVWVNGDMQPRGLGALAKSLSMDLRSMDRGWLKTKMDSLAKTPGEAFSLTLPDGNRVVAPSLVSGFAMVLRAHCLKNDVFADGPTPVLDALVSKREPKAGPDGTLAWTVDVKNAVSGDDFALFLKELTLPGEGQRPYSVWLSGDYPPVLDGLLKSLSYDMRVVDPAWIGAKLRQLLDFAEPGGDFMAFVPGAERQTLYPSTVAYVARLIIHRYVQLGVLDDEGFPMSALGAVEFEDDTVVPIEAARAVGAMEVAPGTRCAECGNNAVIRKDGCKFCTACGALGDCG